MIKIKQKKTFEMIRRFLGKMWKKIILKKIRWYFLLLKYIIYYSYFIFNEYLF